MPHSNNPTISASRIASSVYVASAPSFDRSTSGANPFETNSDTKATGPIASWRDDPKKAYTKMGINPESA
jgi:hypothetical protein